MAGSLRKAIFAAAAVCAAAIVGTAFAANSTSIVDPSNDSGLAPDIAGVTITSDDAGMITVRIQISESFVLGAALGEIGFGIDVDQQPDTGSLYYGTEFGMALEELDPTYFAAAPSGELEEARAPGAFQGSFSGRAATFTFKASDFGIKPGSGFNLFAIGDVLGWVDTAPDIRTVNHQLVAGTPAVVPGSDTRAPVVQAIKSKGVHGKKAALEYYTQDGRGQTADTIRVYRGKKLLKTLKNGLSDRNPFFEYAPPWKVPKNIRGSLRFCVSAVDAAGNASNTSCASLKIK